MHLLADIHSDAGLEVGEGTERDWFSGNVSLDGCVRSTLDLHTRAALPLDQFVSLQVKDNHIALTQSRFLNQA